MMTDAWLKIDYDNIDTNEPPFDGYEVLLTHENSSYWYIAAWDKDDWGIYRTQKHPKEAFTHYQELTSPQEIK